MSEPKVSNDSELERRELSDEEHAEIDMETDNKEAENPQSPAEGNLESNGSELIETPIVHKPSENMVNDDGLPLESQGGAEIPVSTNLVTNDFDQNDLKENIAEEKHEMGKEHLENEEKVVDAEETEDHAEENQTDETHMETERDEALTKEDGAGGDSLKQIEEPVLSFRFDPFVGGDDDGTEEDQAAFMRELENFHKEMNLEFKAPKFYGEGLNCLKLWRAVTRLGGYDQVTSCKLWRQVGESFKPPKTCTTVSWSFRSFYEKACLILQKHDHSLKKALYKYEMHKIRTGELRVPISYFPEPMTLDHQTSGSGRARRDAAARAMQGWHSRLLGNGEVGGPIIKDKTSASLLKRDKLNKNIGGLKRKKSLGMEYATKVCHKKGYKPQVEAMVVDIGHPADWVKINVKRTKDCFEVYALVPGLLREEVHVQSDPAGRLILSGEPEQPDNPWGVTPFKKVLTLPSRIDPHQTSAVVTLHGQLFVRAPFERSDL